MSLIYFKSSSFKKKLSFITIQIFIDENIIISSLQTLLFNIYLLKKHINYQYNLLTCISGIDLLNKLFRFSIIYEVLSITFNNRLRIKIFLNENISVPTIINLYVNANWWEREIWDMYGIYFGQHPDLRRILTDYGFDNNPMRKDFPLSGFEESRYDVHKKRVISEPLELMQEFRSFNYKKSWSFL